MFQTEQVRPVWFEMENPYVAYLEATMLFPKKIKKYLYDGSAIYLYLSKDTV